MRSPRPGVLLVLLAGGAALLAACAEGSPIDAFQSSNGDGGASGDGGRNAGGDGPSDGGAGSVSTTGIGSTTATVGSTSSATSSTSSTSGTSTSASTTSSTSSTSSTSATTGGATTSSASTGGGPEICDPLNPAPVCGVNQHCLPEPTGTDASCAPSGQTQIYGACDDNVQCTAISECVDVGDPFAFPCCLQYCRNAGDCGGLGSCFFFDPPLFADGVQFGVCYDEGGGCF